MRGENGGGQESYGSPDPYDSRTPYGSHGRCASRDRLGPHGPHPARDPRDPGAQPERTRLAWRRTTLTFVVSVGLVLRQVLSGGAGALPTAALAVGVLALLAFLGVAHRRMASMAVSAPGAMGTGVPMAAALCTVTLAIVGVVLLW